ncbi:MAG TPA: RNA polymerase sigma-70 factor [Puia sp.]|nr:RNA polymerase sigma-70 factor [Puia sp.]
MSSLPDPRSYQNDETLLQRLCNGDEQAFNALVTRHWGRVYGHALAYLKSSQRAEELTQDVFVRLWQRREKLPELESFVDYLFIMVRNQLVSALRKRLVETVPVDAEYPLAAEFAPDLRMELRDLQDILNKGIEALPPQQKTAFKLVRVEGLTQDEAAQRMGISKRTVRFHLTQAYNFLRDWLAGQGLGWLAAVLFFGATLSPGFAGSVFI